MIKKIVLIIIGISLLISLGTFLYVYRFQNMPEFSISLLKNISNPEKNQKILILSPHNDDEVLGSGGYIYDAIKNNAIVTIVFLTNGDGHRFSSVEEFHRLYPTSNDYIKSGYTRQNESIKALQKLGIKQTNIIFLGYPDGGLKQLFNKNWDNPYESKFTKQNKSPYNNSYSPGVTYTGQNVYNDLIGIFNQIKPDIIIIPNSKDTNPDHAATYDFSKKTLIAYEKSGHKTPKVYYYLIHYWHFPYPKGNHENNNLMPPMRLLFQNWQKYDLSTNTEIVKKQALDSYSSQLKVPLLNSLMEGFVKKNELFVTSN